MVAVPPSAVTTGPPVLPHRILFVTFAEPVRTFIPCPELPVIVQKAMVATVVPTAIPPPSRLELPQMVQPITVGEEPASLMSPPPAQAAVLPVITHAAMVGELPEHRMPPPNML